MLVLSIQQSKTQGYSVHYHIRRRKAANLHTNLFNNRLLVLALTVDNTNSWIIHIHVISLVRWGTYIHLHS